MSKGVFTSRRVMGTILVVLYTRFQLPVVARAALVGLSVPLAYLVPVTW